MEKQLEVEARSGSAVPIEFEKSYRRAVAAERALYILLPNNVTNINE